MRFLPIESRNAPMGRPLPPPHALALDGALFADPAARFANLHFIRTEGVAGGARKRCVECWCTPVVNASAPLGGMGCCGAFSCVPGRPVEAVNTLETNQPSNHALITDHSPK
jgi:hypothetical protein